MEIRIGETIRLYAAKTYLPATAEAAALGA
jgi:hypothetical protein